MMSQPLSTNQYNLLTTFGQQQMTMPLTGYSMLGQKAPTNQIDIESILSNLLLSIDVKDNIRRAANATKASPEIAKRQELIKSATQKLDSLSNKRATLEGYFTNPELHNFTEDAIKKKATELYNLCKLRADIEKSVKMMTVDLVVAYLSEFQSAFEGYTSITDDVKRL